MVRPPLAMVLVAAADRRLLPALALTPQLAGYERRAVHIAIDPAESTRLGRDWMSLALDGLPLHIEEPTAPTIPLIVRDLVRRELAERPAVTVIVPEMDLGRWWQPLLHRGMGRAVAWELDGIEGATTVVLPMRVDLVRALRR
ncbi:MAG TPA: hypothetical protein VM030_01630 [Acidimicrobiales bacterium]|nr:hypothetical protein [Acidimicrobiales bacterium]